MKFPMDEMRKLLDILPEWHAVLPVKKLKALFLSKISGGRIDFRGEFPPPTLRKETLHVLFAVAILYIMLSITEPQYGTVDQKNTQDGPVNMNTLDASISGA